MDKALLLVLFGNTLYMLYYNIGLKSVRLEALLEDIFGQLLL